jgi:hypothetical protein
MVKHNTYRHLKSYTNGWLMFKVFSSRIEVKEMSSAPFSVAVRHHRRAISGLSRTSGTDDELTVLAPKTHVINFFLILKKRKAYIVHCSL